MVLPTSMPHKGAELLLEPADNARLANLCGQYDEHLRQLERRLGVTINNRGAHFQVVGDDRATALTVALLKSLYRDSAKTELTPAQIHLSLQEASLLDLLTIPAAADPDPPQIVLRGTRIRPKGPNQRRYIQSIQGRDLTFGIGPAGTGKTYLAVACAVAALEDEQVRRLVLVRPAVEAGERLGFLPGDLAQKVDPYLRPMYDALYEFLGFDKVGKLMERQVIEVAPLAYMRGRTLNDAFIILDEAQNTTIEQMKMFLTRIGFGSTAVVNGDITQTDLPPRQRSGLRQVIEVLQGVDGIGFQFFTAQDVVRHPLVQRIVQAYEVYEVHGAKADAGGRAS